ncbi:MAG: UDP-N-acetylmuramoyl-L-alanyl-D-glutamate--2,6-diaminopimelate ligase [Bdellovibrionales bacterium]
MKTAQLFKVFPQLKWGQASTAEVLDITQDSRSVKPGSVFVAVRGTSGDGHDFLGAVVRAGAIALVVEDDSNIPTDYQGAVVKVASTRLALEMLADRFFGEPAQKLFCVGITGTNGKTTTAYMVERILTEFGWQTGVMGTIDHHLGERQWTSGLTTPDPLTLRRRLKEFVSLGAQAAVFEVSSHALTQSRVDRLPFSVGIFTNFTRDHLDYHRSMEEYFAAKERLFNELLGQAVVRVAILNADDPMVRKVRVREGVETWSFGQKDADFLFRILKSDMAGSLFHLSTPHGNVEIDLPCVGFHNVYNATAAAAAGVAAGASLKTVQAALKGFFGAPGRLERVDNSRGAHIFVDYAHTDDALDSVLRSLRELKSVNGSKGRIITVFGCGGDRDKGKRPLMAQAAARHSDVLIMTSDNPRTEDPEQILSEIAAGLPKNWAGEVHFEVDRRQALSLSLQLAQEGDVILVAGKGHEDYQIIGQERRHFSDVETLTELLRG